MGLRDQAEPVAPPAWQSQALEDNTAANAPNAAATGFFNGLPVIGPWAKGKMQELTAWGQSKATGESYDQAIKDVQGAGQASTEAYPWTSGAGRLAGGIRGAAPLMAGAGAVLPSAWRRDRLGRHDRRSGRGRA